MALTIRTDLTEQTDITAAYSVVDIASANAYHDVGGNNAWFQSTEEVRMEALVRADRYLFSRYTFVSPEDPVPAKVKSAAAILALKALEESLTFDPASAESSDSGTVRSTTRRVGTLTSTTTYDTDGVSASRRSSGRFRTFPEVDALLQGIATASSGTYATHFAGRR